MTTSPAAPLSSPSPSYPSPWQRPSPWSLASSLPAAVICKAGANDEEEWDEGFQDEDLNKAHEEEDEDDVKGEGDDEEQPEKVETTPRKKNPRPASAAPSSEGGDPGDLTCAICLDSIPLEDLATVPGCEHAYCAACIVGWAVASSPAGASGAEVSGQCPQCKRGYASVATHRRLDGSLSDFPVEEAVCLLRRARWFCDGAAAAAAVRPRSPPMTPSDIDQADRINASGGSGSGSAYRRQQQHYYDDEDDDDDLDDDHFDDESFYFSAAAGSARVVLGNRRWGEHGYVAAGRMRARPSRNYQQLQQRQKQLLESKGKGKAKNSKGKAPLAAAGPSTSAARGVGSSSAATAAAVASSAPVAINSKGKAPAVLAAGCGTGAAASSLDSTSGGRFGSFVPGSSFDAVAGTSAGAAATMVAASSAEKGRRARRAERRAALDARQQVL